MKTILITSANNHTITSTIYSLRTAFYSKIISVDRKKNNLSKHLVDLSLIVPKNEESYLKKLVSICKKYDVDAIIPHSIADRILLMNNKELFNCPIVSASAKSIRLSDNKKNFAEVCKKLNIPVPEQYVANTSKQLIDFSKKLGYPGNKIIVKPVISKGGRGFRILHDDINQKNLFYSDKSNGVELTLDGLLDIIGDDFPDLIVSEYLPGIEYSVDCLKHDDLFVAVPRTRNETKMGLTSHGFIEKNELLIDYSKKLAEELGLTTVFGFQFKQDKDGVLKALECNPRIQGTMIMSTLAGANLIAESLRLLLGKPSKGFDIDWSMEFQRVWSGISVGEKKTYINLEMR